MDRIANDKVDRDVYDNDEPVIVPTMPIKKRFELEHTSEMNLISYFQFYRIDQVSDRLGEYRDCLDDRTIALSRDSESLVRF